MKRRIRRRDEFRRQPTGTKEDADETAGKRAAKKKKVPQCFKNGSKLRHPTNIHDGLDQRLLIFFGPTPLGLV